MYPIRPVPKCYAWGSRDRLQTMFASSLERPCDGPLAEMWFSGHAQWPSLIDMRGEGGGEVALTDAIRREPDRLVGTGVSEWFGPVLPYLLKVISARIPLSLQVHPVGFEARAGFNAENAAGVPFDAAERSFKDPVAKSEMVLALEGFQASVGFSSVHVMRANLQLVDHPVSRRMVAALTVRSPRRGEAPAGFEQADAMMPMAAMAWPESARQVFRAFHSAVTAREGAGVAHALRDASMGASSLKSRLAFEHAQTATAAFGDDPAALCLLMMNPVNLNEGESVFIPAGTPHIYIRGTAAEIMTNSDNVLRAGMTVKHKDIPNLLRNLDCRPASPANPVDMNLRSLAARDLMLYKPDITEFMLVYGHVDLRHGGLPMAERIGGRYGKLVRQLGARRSRPGMHGPHILLCTEGAISCASERDSRILTCGQAVFIPAQEEQLTVGATTARRGAGDEGPHGSFVLASTQL